MGYDVIITNPGEDGNLTSNHYYIRDRYPKKHGEDFPVIFYGSYQIRFPHEDFNHDGEVDLSLSGNLDLAKFKNKKIQEVK
jgi:hypothetical protein